MSSTSDPTPAGRLARDAVLAAMSDGGVASADAALDAVAAAMASPAVADRLVALAAEAQSVAWAAWNLRDDLYESPTTPEMAARIVLDVVAAALGRPTTPCQISRAEAERAVAGLEYRDWRFDIVEQPDGLHVRVVATVPDSRRGSEFTFSRTAPIRGCDVAGAAFAGVLEIEEHEAMERFRSNGAVVFDPHAAPAAFVAEAALRKRP